MNQIQQYLDKLEINQIQAALYLGVNPRTMRRWVSDETPCPKSTLTALESMIRLKDVGLKWKPSWIEHLGNFRGKIGVL